MQEYYKILNIEENASDEEIEKAYKLLKDKYSKERFLEGEEGNQAAKNLTKLETAYYEIKVYRKSKNDKYGEKVYNFEEVETLIKANKINDAQDALDKFNDRNAEWHYLQSVIFYKKNWINESKKQLEIAMNMEPHNSKYKDAYTKLKMKIEYNDRQFYSGNAQYNNSYQNQQRQMGGTNSDCLDWCTTMCCMNMMCNMCCR